MRRRRRNKDRVDELLLAAALAAARARGLGHCTGRPFMAVENGQLVATPYSDRAIVACCAAGALELARKVRDATRLPKRLELVYNGNDGPARWSDFRADRGESLGWAFREAMTS